jgi:hypothetical protein
MRERRLLRWIGATAVLLAVAVLAFLFGYPAVFPEPLSQPSFNVDAAEGKVWTNSEVVVEVRGHLTAEEAVRSLKFDPPIELGPDDVKVEHSARLPGHETLPWATTRIIINSGRGALFAADTQYALEVDGRVASFETITMPAVLAVHPADEPGGSLENVPTGRDIAIVFNEQVAWEESLLKIEPSVEVTTAVESLPTGATAVRIKPPGRWENSTRYALTIAGAIQDLYGHTGDVAFSTEFATWAQPKVLTVAPQGESQPVESPIQIEFERDVDRASVQEAFRIEPAESGTFEWQSERLLVWRPQGLQHSTSYRASVGGKALGGDTFVGTEWSFRTHDPPVFVEIKGRNQAPTVLEAFPSGGLGTFALQWSTGDTAHKILFPGPGAAPHTVAVTVSSGDRTTTTAIEVAPAPNNGFTPVGCPAGWDLIEVSVCYRSEEIPGPIRTYTTRIDLKDPNLQTRSVPAAGVLGAWRPTSEEAKASKSMVTVNGDFFYSEPRGSYTLGPMVTGGNFFYAPASPEVVLALGRDDSPWVGAASELRFALQSADGSAIPLQGVNHIPGEHAASVFNGYWGPELTLEADGCFAAFAPPDQNLRVPDVFACGPLAGIALPPGTFTIVARGAAAEWLQAQSKNPLGIAHSFPLGGVDFMVGGSHVLVAGGAQPAITPDKRHPRTAIGVDAAGFLYLLVVDGRSEKSLGMTLPELQAYVTQMGMTNAINLDGGGSSTLVLRETLMNVPAEGKERPVASVVEVGPPRPRCRHAFVGC